MRRKLLGYTLEYTTKNIWEQYETTRQRFDRMIEVEDAIDALKEIDVEIISIYLRTNEEIVLDN